MVVRTVRRSTPLVVLTTLSLAALPRVLAAQPATVTCSSRVGEKQQCPADTSGGVALQRSTGEAACLLGRTWGYDQASVWVSDGCGGEFVLGQPVSGVAPTPAGTAEPAVAPVQKEQPSPRIESWGEFEPGDGFLIGRSSAGELSISAYALVRYINQLPADQTFTDHLGNVRDVDTRNDIYAHRAMVFLKGWLVNPKLVYTLFFWTVNATDQDALFGSMGYQFSRKFSLYGGINGLPGTRSLQGSHPYWLGHDRVMADEFFRPYFSAGVWAQGEVLPGLWYNAMLANNLSALGIKATQLDRDFGAGASVWWMPTTHEFGPRGAYGDWEMHEKVATRFGVSACSSPEERFTDGTTGATGNTTLRLADSLNVFDKGSLAPDVTFLGFELGPETARGDQDWEKSLPGWFFVLQQPPGVDWGSPTHSAALAYITLQGPFRVAIHASDLLPEP
jgi:hypothetical protein